jgi:hypothetical protein
VGIREWEMRNLGSKARRKIDDEECGAADVWEEGRERDIDMNMAQCARRDRLG